MKTIVLVLISIFEMFGQSIYSQTNWYQQSINNGIIKVSFPGKPEKSFDPNTNVEIYLFDNINSNFLVIASPSNLSLENLHSTKTIQSIVNELTDYNNELIISTNKTFYKNKRSLDIYYKKLFQNSYYLYHRARAVQIDDNYFVILLYTYKKYNKLFNDKFFNSLIFDKEKDDKTKYKLNQYLNNRYHFSFLYPNSLLKLPDEEIEEINNLSHNKKLNLTYEAGFKGINNEVPPLILVYVLKSQKPSDFNKLVEKYTYTEIDLTKISEKYNNILPILKSTKIDKPTIDLENKIIMFTAEIDSKTWPNISKGMYIQFYGKEKIVQINLASTINTFESDFQKYILPIIKSFSFNKGYNYSKNEETKNDTDQTSQTYDLVRDFLNGYTSTYKCDGTGKGRGLKFSIKYPHSWKSEEGRRPHIVRKFINNNSITQAMVIVNDLGFTPTKEDIDYFFSSINDFEKTFVPEGSRIIKSSKTVIDGEPALVIDYMIEREKLGTIIKTRARMYSLIYKNNLLQVQFYVVQPPLDKPIDLEKEFLNKEMLFNLMINSLIIDSKWEDY